MPITKLFEVRDKSTFMPVMATKTEGTTIKELYLFHRAGYSQYASLIIVTRLEEPQSTYSPYDWRGSRTMQEAHKYIQDHFDKLVSGAVIDIEFILGETDTPKISEIEGTI